jgi:hypothetical protein
MVQIHRDALNRISRIVFQFVEHRLAEPRRQRDRLGTLHGKGPGAHRLRRGGLQQGNGKEEHHQAHERLGRGDLPRLARCATSSAAAVQRRSWSGSSSTSSGTW